MITISREDRCCGCGACSNVCPKHCITMKEAKDGFRYPVAEQANCIDCGLCEEVCPYINLSVKGDILRQPAAYCTRSKDENVLKTSSSGGIFYELAKVILHKGGVVFGAVWGDAFNEVYHRSVRSIDELSLLQGSKYLQSEIRNCFSEAKELLDAGIPVLFSGTPCQIAGLLSFLGRKAYEHLLTCDLLCHGIPTPLALRRFIAEKEMQTGKTVSGYYRDKSQGWSPTVFKIVYADGSSEVLKPGTSYVNRMFSEKNTYHRNSCYCCRFQRMPRIADLSLGDYFVLKNARDLHGNEVAATDNKGLSLITVNTAQGNQYFEEMKASIEYTELKLHTVTAHHLFQGPGIAANPPSRQMFYFLYNKGLSTQQIWDIMYGNAGRFKKLYYRMRQKMNK